MEMNQEALVAEGFSHKQASAILEAHKRAVAGQFVPKARFDEVSGELSSLREQAAQRDQQVFALEGFESMVGRLKEEIEHLTQLNQQKSAEMEQAVADERKTGAIRLKLKDQVHDVDMALAAIDLGQVTYADGELGGIDHQIEALRNSSKRFLFVDPKRETKPKVKIVGKAPPEGAGGDLKDPYQPKDMGRRLAEKKLAGKQEAQKAANHYFKGGNT